MKTLFPLFLFFAFTQCAPPAAPLSPAFFCWETTLNIPAEDRSMLDSMGCKKLYVKILDIGRNAQSGEIEPYSRTEMSDTSALAGLQVIPTVFITNEVFQQISETQLDWLAGKIAGQKRGAGLLIDCDWTASTQVSFFRFLKLLRQKLPSGLPLSATIRLHQYKFPKQTGVPPVDRGMLMFYNTGDVDEESERNSIFHPEEALKYATPNPYPLPLDLALPIFSWGLVYREGELWKIVPGPLPLEEMRRSGKYLEHPSQDPFATTLWELKEGTFLGGHYLRPGDHLRVSGISPEALFKIAEMAQKLDLAEDASLAFFHLGQARSAHFSAQLLDSVCITVRKYPMSNKKYPMSK